MIELARSLVRFLRRDVEFVVNAFTWPHKEES